MQFIAQLVKNLLNVLPYGDKIKAILKIKGYDFFIWQNNRIGLYLFLPFRIFFQKKTSFPLPPRRILIDISNIAKFDSQSGIPRVVKQLVFYLDKLSGSSFQSIAVYAYKGDLYYAERFTRKLCGKQYYDGRFPLKILPQDILLMADACWFVQENFKNIFIKIHESGGEIYTFVHDLIPLLYQELVPQWLPKLFKDWLLSALANGRGLIAISKTVADETIEYVKTHNLPHRQELKIAYSHNGADIRITKREHSIRKQMINCFNKKVPIFLILGSIDIRKGHAFVLKAFENLWSEGVEACLCIAGQQGWGVEAFMRSMFEHPELNKHIFWFNHPTDAEVIYCYQHARALIFASETEGFGLPLTEAAQYGLPIICSDIPVFREICKEHATYFSLASSQNLVSAIKNWLNDANPPNSSMISWLTWEESAKNLLDILLNQRWYQAL